MHYHEGSVVFSQPHTQTQTVVVDCNLITLLEEASRAQTDDEAHADIYPLHTTHSVSLSCSCFCVPLSCLLVSLASLWLLFCLPSLPAPLKYASLMSFSFCHSLLLSCMYSLYFTICAFSRDDGYDIKKTHDRDINANINGCHVLCSVRSTPNKTNKKTANETTIQTDNLAHPCPV